MRAKQTASRPWIVRVLRSDQFGDVVFHLVLSAAIIALVVYFQPPRNLPGPTFWVILCLVLAVLVACLVAAMILQQRMVRSLLQLIEDQHVGILAARDLLRQWDDACKKE